MTDAFSLNQPEPKQRYRQLINVSTSKAIEMHWGVEANWKRKPIKGRIFFFSGFRIFYFFWFQKIQSEKILSIVTKDQKSGKI